jgi:hypothetical protein
MSKKKGLVFHPDTSKLHPQKYAYKQYPSEHVKYCCGHRNIGSEIFEEHFHVCLACLTAYSNDEKRVVEKNNGSKPSPFTKGALKALEYPSGIMPTAKRGVPLTDEEFFELEFRIRTSVKGSVEGKLEFLRAYQ